MRSNSSLFPVQIFLKKKDRGGDETEGVEGGNTRASPSSTDGIGIYRLPLHLRLWMPRKVGHGWVWGESGKHCKLHFRRGIAQYL